MGNTLMSELQRISQLHDELMVLSCESRWDEFIAALGPCADLLREAMLLDSSALNLDELAAARELITTLQDNEALMVQRMRARLDQLREEMSGLNKGKAVSNAYAAPFTASIR
uniref:Flagellar protein FliT n=1 Tax=Erwinia amylovora ATCC BAA-2158 TaxID=889211 RepID=E5B7U8_ERWAM|nr:hypothetical protein predicted by Glimmer/Critica [Erwinia amylovora ATCC BAA-2158]